MAAALQPQAAPLTPKAKPTAPAAAPPAAANDPSKNTEAVTVHGPFTMADMADKFEEYTEKKQDILDKRGNLKPPPNNPPPQPDVKQTDAVEAWGSSAMAMAVIGSFFTRTPLTTALNSAAGVMKAIKANDIETAKTQFDNWKVAYDEYEKSYNYQVELYKSALAQSDRDEKTADATFLAYTRAMGDETARLSYEQNGRLGYERLAVAREQLHNAQARDAPKVIAGGEFVKAWTDPAFQAKYQAEKDPTKKMLMVALLQSGMTQDDLDFKTEQILSGDPNATVGMPVGPQGNTLKAVLAHNVTQTARARGMTGEDVTAAKARFRGMAAAEASAGRQFVPIARAVKEIDRLAPLVLSSAKKLDLSQYRTMNDVINVASREGSSEELRAFAMNVQAFVSNYSTMINRGGGNTDASNAAAKHLLDQNDPTSIVNTVTTQAALEGYATMGALQDAEIGLRQLFGGAKNLGPFLITTKQQFDALPPDAEYFKVDGSHAFKPGPKHPLK